MAPLPSVCSTSYGHHKPWKTAASVIALTALIALIAFLGFVEHSGAVSAIRVKRPVIENVGIDEHQARSVCTLAQRLIEAR